MQPRAHRLTAAVALATAVVLALLGGTAYAAWTTSGAGNGAAKAQSLVAPVASATAQSAASIQVTWTVGTQPPGTTYSVVRDGSTTLGCSSSPCLDTGLAPSTSHSYVVKAILGTAWLAASNTASATTPAATVATKFAVSLSSSVTAGAPVAITITAQDGANNTVTSYTGSQTLAWSGTATAASPNGTAPTLTTAVTFSNGVANLSAQKLTRAGTGLTLTATQGSLSGSATVTVSAGSVTRLAYTNMTFSSNPGFTTCYASCTAPNQGSGGSVAANVSLVDDFGNLSTRSTSTTVGFSPTVGSSSPSVAVTPSGSTTAIPANTSTSTWTVKLTEGSASYTTTLTATSSPLAPIDVTIKKNN